MTDALILAGLILTGPVTHTDHAAVAPTSDGQFTYVSAIECRRGAGWLMKTAPDGTGLRRNRFYTLYPTRDGIGGDTAAGAATILCKPFTNGAKQ